MNATARAILLLGLAAAAAGCRRENPDAPPVLHLGRDQCAECGMILDDEKSACALRLDASGGTETLLFDDLGCLLQHEIEHPEIKPRMRWAHDWNTRAWITCETASYVVSEALRTPMMSGFAAFADAPAAEKAARDASGVVATFADIRSRRAELIRRRAPQAPASSTTPP